MSEAQLDQELAASALSSAEHRAVYADWLLERGDPRGELLIAARALKDAGSATARSGARLEIVAALKRLATWLDGHVPEGKPWRPADVRGVTSDALGFLSHDEGVLHRFRVAAGRASPLPPMLWQAVPSLIEVGVPASPPPRTGLSAQALHPARLLDLLGPSGVARFDCFDVELPGSLARLGAPDVDDAGWRFAGLEAALRERTRPAELRLFDGAMAVESLGALLSGAPNVSLFWLEQVRLPVDGVDGLRARPGVVPHLRLVETPIDVKVALGLARARCLEGLQRLEVKDWSVTAPALEALLAGAPALQHLALIRCPLGADLVRVLTTSGRLQQLETLDASGCLLALGGVSALLRSVGPATRRLVLRFNQLTESDLASLARLEHWPKACEVRFEEVTFGPGAHQALAAVAQAHGLRVEVSGCVLSLRSP